MLVKLTPEALITPSRNSIDRFFLSFGTFPRRATRRGDKDAAEKANLWNTKLRGSTYLRPLFITDQLEPQIKTIARKSSQFLSPFN